VIGGVYMIATRVMLIIGFAFLKGWASSKSDD
jgi:hypothetical protein